MIMIIGFVVVLLQLLVSNHHFVHLLLPSWVNHALGLLEWGPRFLFWFSYFVVQCTLFCFTLIVFIDINVPNHGPRCLMVDLMLGVKMCFHQSTSLMRWEMLVPLMEMRLSLMPYKRHFQSISHSMGTIKLYSFIFFCLPTANWFRWLCLLVIFFW